MSGPSLRLVRRPVFKNWAEKGGKRSKGAWLWEGSNSPFHLFVASGKRIGGGNTTTGEGKEKANDKIEGENRYTSRQGTPKGQLKRTEQIRQVENRGKGERGWWCHQKQTHQPKQTHPTSWWSSYGSTKTRGLRGERVRSCSE